MAHPEFAQKLLTLILQWEAASMPLQPGASPFAISAAEALIGYRFEDDFRAYLAAVNGSGQELDAEMFAFWSLDEIRANNTSGYYPTDHVWFADYFMNIFSYGFSRADGGIYIALEGKRVIDRLTGSFAGFLDLYLEDPFLLQR
ncbi:SMI1/KNR4 family protein [Flaviaesturariibacter amylovorans]|uniref:Knr4/Smi1-like domain-containing protein n=1 Tax=Flaviaesturariibacter amylovorans TaxID=1084520 RepID=A0ABP8H3N2_9BACT